MQINESRPLEKLVGDNRGMVRFKLGRIHCMTSVLDCAREMRCPGIRDMPVALRRGLALCVIETIAEYRGTYIGVMGCESTEPVQSGAFD